ncbi:Cysteine rich repeat-containing protein [Roseibium hamelinense]|uniref:Cysteine rich repeat-containing protein n=1 Tax=Roseibium hamelinense TaxID=150831 RepID=A0A562TGT1_9HYPH|nr:cysteine rich repeat-containing protein [Roseibium hamelinense]MTI45974.1 hypothetical protein [Roseibium hamelinense]TWI92837.1 Cysteine rich repeat-containing protein [Roseibium hamelinense]
MSRLSGIVVSVSVLAASLAFDARQDAQASSLMTACKVDIDTLCKGVKEGRGRVSACLFAHDTKVSGTCKPELAKVTGSSTFKKMLPASLNSLHGSDQAAALQQTCGNDIKAQCGGVGAGTDKVLACLYSRSSSISKPCYAKAKALIEGE